MRAVFFSNVGGYRDHNEDALLCGDVYCKGMMVDIEEVEFSPGSVLVAVADGMGGGPGGADAAELMLCNLRELTAIPYPPDAKTIIEDNINHTADCLVALGDIRPDLSGLGTTVVGVWVNDTEALIFNCGDSRIYRVRQGYLDHISKDHSLVYELYSCGEITEEEMSRHPLKNVLTSSIQDCPDYPRIFFREVNVNPGDSFFLCSDGVWEAVSREEIEALLSLGSPEESARELVKILLERQCRDNITFVWLY
ncbi:MAG: serine/threonine-protein phosphatase [Deltaproteobacteria bacterium]|jgi:serine/threonine protein phosphatase PrpC|nr:serine/threonine-protein phosphatase [Deltaproteobacteria bacterium]